jgi:2'-5' RNA ligase
MKYLKLYESFLGDNCIVFEAALLLKLDSSIKSQIKEIYESSEEAKMLFPLSDDKLHITLTSIKNCKENKEKLKSELPKMEMPKIILGQTTFAERPETGKKSFVVAIENQADILQFVNQIYESMGLTNPEPERYFHITIANNVENKKVPGTADPFGSIGDVKKEDFV